MNSVPDEHNAERPLFTPMTRGQAEAFIFGRVAYHTKTNSVEQTMHIAAALSTYLAKNRDGIVAAIMGLLDGSSLEHALTYNRWWSADSLWHLGANLAGELRLHECIPPISAALARKDHQLATNTVARAYAEKALRRLESP